MEEKKIIEFGYLPKELPPGFLSKDLSNNLEEVKTRWQTFYDSQHLRLDGESRGDFNSRKRNFSSKYSSSKCWIYSISKGIYSRRPLGIPNPKHFIKVVELTCSKWDDFQNIFSSSKFSTSYPIEETRTNKRSVRTFSKSVADLRDKVLERSVNKLYQVKLDISKYYPTIYTHVIPWSFLGKEVSKSYLKKSQIEIEAEIAANNANALLYVYGNKLDTAIRNCQDKQSVGIPIGPDTSHIVSELVACKIDEEFNSEFEMLGFEGCRYFDDYYIFVDSRDQADVAIKGLQKILNKYQLELNDKKIEVKSFPFAFENEWVTDLHRFEFKETNFSIGLKHYFSLIWSIAEENKSRTDWIFKYSLRRFEFVSVEIPKKSWKVFENLLFKTTLIQPSILDITTRICLTYKEYLDDDSNKKLKDLVKSVIESQTQVNHNFEVSWALWMAKTFELEIKEEIAKMVLKTKDPTSILILLCLDKVHSLVEGDTDYSEIETELVDNVLFSEYWVLAYQAIKNNWLTSSEPDLIDKNEFFKILIALDIDFFDCSVQLKVYKEITPESEEEPYSEEVDNSISEVGDVSSNTDVIEDQIEVDENEPDQTEIVNEGENDNLEFIDISPFI